MKYIVSFLVKFVCTAVILGIVLLLMTSLTFGQILVVSAAVTIISYFVGDLLILSVSNNTIATIADIALSFFTIYLFNFWANYTTITFAAALVASIALGAGEWFFHKYMVRSVYHGIKRENR